VILTKRALTATGALGEGVAGLPVAGAVPEDGSEGGDDGFCPAVGSVEPCGATSTPGVPGNK
jgi:hypothetical protein